MDEKSFKFDRILEAILKKHRHSMESFPSLGEMIEEYPYGKQTLARRFKESRYGSYRGFRQAAILQVADNLKGSGLEIKDCLGLLGFSDYKSFWRFSKRVSQVTPNELMTGPIQVVKPRRVWRIYTGILAVN